MQASIVNLLKDMRIEENETQRENIDAIVIRNVSWLKISCLKWEDPDSMKYTISEMASLLGVTTHMLRHYEKMGIISPEVNEQTGYRYYTVLGHAPLQSMQAVILYGALSGNLREADA